MCCAIEQQATYYCVSHTKKASDYEWLLRACLMPLRTDPEVGSLRMTRVYAAGRGTSVLIH